MSDTFIIKRAIFCNGLLAPDFRLGIKNKKLKALGRLRPLKTNFGLILNNTLKGAEILVFILSPA